MNRDINHIADKIFGLSMRVPFLCSFFFFLSSSSFISLFEKETRQRRNNFCPCHLSQMNVVFDSRQEKNWARKKERNKEFLRRRCSSSSFFLLLPASCSRVKIKICPAALTTWQSNLPSLRFFFSLSLSFLRMFIFNYFSD